MIFFKKTFALLILFLLTFLFVFTHFNLMFKIDRDNELNIKLNSVIIEQNNYIIQQNNQVLKNTKGKWI